MRSVLAVAIMLATVYAQSTYPQQVISGSDFGIPGKNATFDYVVVGGGTGGLAMAYRLAEDGTNSVAVVEAGGFYEIENGNRSVVPAYNNDFNYITPDSRWDAPLVDWGFLTTPQAGAQGGVFHYGRGKMLGGCSAENAMNYNRPTIGALQQWATLVNDTSYLWDNLLPYYTRSINYTAADAQLRASNATVPVITNSSIASHLGPLDVSYPNFATPIASWAELAFIEMGFNVTHDQISGELIGSQYNTLTERPKDQSRSSSQTSFLDSAFQSGRTNLQVYTHSLVQKILFDNKTAYGVSVTSGPSPVPYMLTARKEVVVSAGAFQSPQLLMVSGVGPSEQLNKYNISIVQDLSGVGQNMWDHVVLSLGYQVNVETIGRLQNATLNYAATTEYNINHTGILTNDLSDYLAWENIPASLENILSQTARNDLAIFAKDWPDIEYEVSSAPFGLPPQSSPENPIDVAYLQAVLLTPLSRGNITLSSASMSDAPVINPNWLTHLTDQEVAVLAMRRAREILNATALQPVLIGSELLPGYKALPLNASDEAILEYTQANIGFNWHASCTCKMGSSDDPMAVVDSHARVFGVKNLRVVDASAFPLLPPGHPQATVYALAEKIADDILNDR